MLTNFENRYAAYVEGLTTITYDIAIAALDRRVWGMETTEQDNLLDDLMILTMWLATVEWCTREHNTFFANQVQVWNAQTGQYVTCTDYLYPSEVIQPLVQQTPYPNKDSCNPCRIQCSPCSCAHSCLCKTKVACNIVQSWIDHFLKCGYDITPMLRSWGVYPVGLRPDGISYMQIQTTSLCNPSIFMVEKQRI